MKKIITLVLFISVEHAIYPMFSDEHKQSKSPAKTTTHRSRLWLKIGDQTIKCPSTTIRFSNLFIALSQLKRHKNKENAFDITKQLGIELDDFRLFKKISEKQEELFNTLKCFEQEKKDKLLSLASALKARTLYAHLLPEYIDNNDIISLIVRHIIPIERIKRYFLKHTELSKVHTSLQMPSIKNFQTTIKTDLNDQFCIVTIKGVLYNNNTYNKCFLLSLSTFKKLRKWFNYDIIAYNAHRNVLALCTLKSPSIQESTLTFYDPSENKEIVVVIPENITTLTFSKDGRYLAATQKSHSNNHALLLWDMCTIDTNQKPTYLIGHTEQVEALHFSPNNTFLISGSPELQNSLITWDLKSPSPTKNVILTNDHRHFTRFIFSKNGSHCVAQTNTKKSLFIYFLDESVHIISIDTPNYCQFSPPYIPSEPIIISKDSEDSEDHYKIYSCYTIPDECELQQIPTIIVPDKSESRIATYSSYYSHKKITFHSYDKKQHAMTTQPLALPQFNVHELKFSTSKFLLALFDNQASLYDKNGNIVYTLPTQKNHHSCTIGTFSENSDYMIIGSFGNHDRLKNPLCLDFISLKPESIRKSCQQLVDNATLLQAVTLRDIYTTERHRTFNFDRKTLGALSLKQLDSNLYELIKKSATCNNK